MVEAFKYLNYCQLAKNSLVSKRFRNVIGTHRHKLALLYVNIRMGRFSGIDPAVIKLFNKEISSEEYNEWVVSNNYSKQTSPICQAVGDRRPYELSAYADYKDPNQESTQVFHARVKELNHETWPLFQHFVRLITDPFICIRNLGLIPQADVLKLLASTIERSNRGRLQCGKLDFNFESNVQESFSCIKDHVRSASFQIIGYRSSPDHDKQLLDFFATGSHCTSETFVAFDSISKGVILDFVQKFMDLKSSDDVQLVESIRGRVSTPTEEALMSNYGNSKFMDLKSRDDSQLVESIRGRVSKLSAEALETNYEKFFIKAEEYEYGWINESFSCIKDHVRCASFHIAGYRSSPDHDKQLLDFFATGSHCTSEIVVMFGDISKAVIVDFVQKFMDLKSRDDSQLVFGAKSREKRNTPFSSKSEVLPD
ncbi:hypothetical protein DdX_18866 [Ditylenchus destructor]|uniref:Uncharacterized protein n=1 Tax=Ditylenchus destructor TaxID=166010 RepID=A0AAD4QUK0_9BILA|nr:hypothetical protein DdX_18866 [Ditylenchus destructor]